MFEWVLYLRQWKAQKKPNKKSAQINEDNNGQYK